MKPEQLAQKFHEAYERLAPSFGYKTREASAKPWADVPEQNRALMTAVAAEVMTNALAELEDMRIAWALLDEPAELQRMPHTATEAAQLFVARRDELRATLALNEAALKNAQEQRDACAVEALEQRQRAERVTAHALMLRDVLEAVLPYAAQFWRKGEQPAACIAEARVALKKAVGT